MKKTQKCYDRKFSLGVRGGLFVEIMVEWDQKYNFTK